METDTQRYTDGEPQIQQKRGPERDHGRKSEQREENRKHCSPFVISRSSKDLLWARRGDVKAQGAIREVAAAPWDLGVGWGREQGSLGLARRWGGAHGGFWTLSVEPGAAGLSLSSQTCV